METKITRLNAAMASRKNVEARVLIRPPMPDSPSMETDATASRVVVIATTLLAVASVSMEGLSGIGGLISTLASTFFLLAIAAFNLVIFVSIYKTYRHVRSGGHYDEEDFDLLLNSRGLLARLFRPMFKMITKS